jgi:hypothetical protein
MAVRLLDDLRNEIQVTFYERGVPLVELVLVHFRDGVGPQALWPVERVRHWGDAGRIDGLELVYHGDDAR